MEPNKFEVSAYNRRHEYIFKAFVIKTILYVLYLDNNAFTGTAVDRFVFVRFFSWANVPAKNFRRGRCQPVAYISVLHTTLSDPLQSELSYLLSCVRGKKNYFRTWYKRREYVRDEFWNE